MKIRNLFCRKRYAKGGVIPKEGSERIEHCTTCDLCENLGDCIDESVVINVRTMMDIQDHYVLGIGSECIKDPVVKLRNTYRKCKDAMNKCEDDKDIATVADWERKANEFQNAFNELMSVLDEIFGG